jgi:hypothetical protein
MQLAQVAAAVTLTESYVSGVNVEPDSVSNASRTSESFARNNCLPFSLLCTHRVLSPLIAVPPQGQIPDRSQELERRSPLQGERSVENCPTPFLQGWRFDRKLPASRAKLPSVQTTITNNRRWRSAASTLLLPHNCPTAGTQSLRCRMEDVFIQDKRHPPGDCGWTSRQLLAHS